MSINEKYDTIVKFFKDNKLNSIVFSSVLFFYMLYKQYKKRNQIENIPKKSISLPIQINNLTITQSNWRKQIITQNVSYILALKLKQGDTYEGIIKIQFQAKFIKDELFLDFSGDLIQQLFIDGKKISYIDYKKNFIQLPQIYFKKDRLNHLIELRFTNKYSKDGNGLHSFIDCEDKQQYIYSNSKPYFCSKIFPCFDQPDIKGSLSLNVFVNKNWTVISNQKINDKVTLKNSNFRLDFGESFLAFKKFLKGVKDNYYVYKFNSTPNISSYLFAIIAGPFQEIKNQKKSQIPMSIFCRKSLSQYLQNDADHIFELTEKAISFFEQFFDQKFPFPKHDQIFCPEFNSEAMENPGAIIYNDTLYVFKNKVTLEEFSRRCLKIVHELALVWFGNMVTVKWWDSIWINESFADYIAQQVLTKINLSFQISDFEILQNINKDWAYMEDQKITTHPLQQIVANTDEALQIFDGVTCAKGASVLRQLMFLIGIQSFDKSFKKYFKEYKSQNSNLKNFLDYFQDEFQKKNYQFNLNQWQQVWFQNSGVNSCEFIVGQNKIKQSYCNDYHQTLRYHKIQLAIYQNNGEYEILDVLLQNTQFTHIQLKNQYAAILPNFNDQSFIKVILDKKSFQFFKQNLNLIRTPLARKIIWRSIYNMVCDAQISSKEFIKIVKNFFQSEELSELKHLILNFMSDCIRYYTPIFAKKQMKKEMFDFFLQLIQSTKDPLYLIQLKKYLIKYADDTIDLKILINQVIFKTEKQNKLQFSISDQWKLCKKTQKNNQIYENLKEQIFEKVKQQDQSDIGKRNSLQIKAMTNDVTLREQYWNEFINENSKSLQYLEAEMKGFNNDQDHTYILPFFDNIIQVFQQKTLYEARSFYKSLFPKCDDLYQIISMIDETIKKVQIQQVILFKMLKESKDFAQKKLKCYQCFNKL